LACRNRRSQLDSGLRIAAEEGVATHPLQHFFHSAAHIHVLVWQSNQPLIVVDFAWPSLAKTQRLFYNSL
jgi:hypothetical protein